MWANWSGVAALQHGGQCGICAQGQYRFPNDTLWFSDGPNSCSLGTMLGRRAYTTIDRSKPTATLQQASGAAFVKDGKVPVKIDFADDVAGPFPANFVCFRVGDGPCDTTAGDVYGYDTSCSVPGSGGRSTTFACTADYGAMPDGSLTACVIAADASIPDNPSGTNQSGTADKANLSNPSRVVARSGVRLDADGTADYRLKLPKGSKAGSYTLKATYQTITASRKLTLTGKSSARRARTSSRPIATVGRGPRALPDGRFHGDRPARTFKVR